MPMSSKEFTAAKLVAFDRLSMDVRLTDLDVRVAWRIISRININNDGWAWPSHGLIAKEVGCHTDSARRSVNRLCATGWLDKVTHQGTSKACSYRLILDNRTVGSGLNGDEKGNAQNDLKIKNSGGIPDPTVDETVPYCRENRTVGYDQSLQESFKEHSHGDSIASPRNSDDAIAEKISKQQSAEYAEYMSKKRSLRSKEISEHEARNRLVQRLGLSSKKEEVMLQLHLDGLGLLQPLVDKELKFPVPKFEILDVVNQAENLLQ